MILRGEAIPRAEPCALPTVEAADKSLSEGKVEAIRPPPQGLHERSWWHINKTTGVREPVLARESAVAVVVWARQSAVVKNGWWQSQ